MITCLGCGAITSENARFCSSCGRAVAIADTPTLEPDRPATAPTPRPPSSQPKGSGGFSPGTVLIERYRIVALVGRGGMGEVYRAEDLKLGNVVALKFLPASLQNDAAALASFHAEVRNARQVSHPNVCRVYDIGEVDGQHFLTMEYIDGEDLASLLRRIGRLPADKALETAHQICAGLAAAHDCGLLHRDLKPANIMLDGRGRVRITDFGLALNSDDATGRSEIAGTPAYMAPEQIAKGVASVRSDIYSMGLVFYELFTGRMPYQASTPIEWRRAHLESSPRTPSSVVKDIDPGVESAILRCLQKDPALRPSSVRQVAAAFPGGDPLAAALAAGETPSPEMVAAAGDEGALRLRTAWLLLSGTILALLALFALVPYGTDWGLAPMDKTPEELEVRAKDIVRGLGYSSAPADSVYWLSRDSDYLQYRALHELSEQWYRDLASSEFGTVRFWYRQSPQPLVPVNGSSLVKKNDPPLEISGMVTVNLNSGGRLFGFRAAPPEIDEPTSEPTGLPTGLDWRPLFAAAGLDAKCFATAAPKLVPPVPFDKRAEWQGNSNENSCPAIHVAAAAYRGKPVYFDIAGPWTRPARTQRPPETLADLVANAGFMFAFLAVFVGGTIFARRNILLGRGDTRGAFRLFVFRLALGLLNWPLWGHLVTDFSSDFGMFMEALGDSLTWAAFVWLSYMALEPYIRRRRPSVLISWTRLLSGKLIDPLVGRDLLAGSLLGVILIGLFYLESALPYWINIRGITPFPWNPTALIDPRRIASLIAWSLQISVISGLGGLAILFLARVVMRRDWLAIIVTGLVMTALSLSQPNILVDFAMQAIAIAVGLFFLIRFGVLAYVAGQLVMTLLTNAAPTANLSYWYAGRSLFVLLLVVALALYGFRLALAGRPLFGGAVLEE